MVGGQNSHGPYYLHRPCCFILHTVGDFNCASWPVQSGAVCFSGAAVPWHRRMAVNSEPTRNYQPIQSNYLALELMGH